jgi:hypothetical protein
LKNPQIKTVDQYRNLIALIPVREQSLTTKRSTWNRAEQEVEWLKILNNEIFNGNDKYTISRQDIFETNVPRQVIIKAIYWGYPRGMRGNHFVNILEKIDLIENTLVGLKQIDNLTSEHFNQLVKTFQGIRGLGLSTYSKLLYFFNLKFNDNPCLILDQRLINVFANRKYSDFEELSSIRYANADRKYLIFLQLLKQLAIKLETKGENIELFLFNHQ